MNFQTTLMPKVIFAKFLRQKSWFLRTIRILSTLYLLSMYQLWGFLIMSECGATFNNFDNDLLMSYQQLKQYSNTNSNSKFNLYRLSFKINFDLILFGLDLHRWAFGVALHVLWKVGIWKQYYTFQNPCASKLCSREYLVICEQCFEANPSSKFEGCSSALGEEHVKFL